MVRKTVTIVEDKDADDYDDVREEEEGDEYEGPEFDRLLG